VLAQFEFADTPTPPFLVAADEVDERQLQDWLFAGPLAMIFSLTMFRAEQPLEPICRADGASVGDRRDVGLAAIHINKTNAKGRIVHREAALLFS
jgi:hypothetical protein